MKTLLATAALGALPLQAPPSEPLLPTLVWADFDRDGYDDALALHAGALALFRNAAAGQQDECAARVGLGSLPPLAAAGWIDYDHDGSADVFAVTAEGAPLLLRNESGAAFLDLTQAAGLTLAAPILKAEWVDVDADGEPDLLAWTPGAVNLFRNVGGTFEPSVLSLASASAPSAPSAFGFRTEPTGGSDTAPETAPAERLRAAGDAGGRAAVSPPGGANPVLGPGNYTTTVGVTPPRSIGVAIPKNCAKFVYDESTQNCVVTSSVPALGQLYPLSTDLNVTPTGRVGVGTSSPLSKLHVESGSETGLTITSDARAATLFSSDVNTATLKVESAGYAGFYEGRLEVGYETGFPLFQDRARIVLDVDTSNAGIFDLYNGSGLRTVRFEAEEFADNGAQFDLATAAGVNTITLDAENGSFGGIYSMRMANGLETVQILAEEATGNGAQLSLRNANGSNTFVVDANTGTGGSELSMYMVSGVESVQILSEESAGNGGEIKLRNGNGTTTVALDGNTQATGGSLFEMFALNGQETVEITADETLGTGAKITLRKYDGTTGISLDASYGGDGRVTTEELRITGGADLVESFDTGGVVCEPGTVVVIDAERPGELKPSARAYDRCVAGVVSGAGGVKPGIHMVLEGVIEGSTPVALTGRVYVRCTDENGPVGPGDLLTTSSTVGCAMRATDPDASFGAVIGKALTAPDESGLVLTLVNLQ